MEQHERRALIRREIVLLWADPTADPVVFMFLIGHWILNGLGVVWVAHRLRRVLAASNATEED